MKHDFIRLNFTQIFLEKMQKNVSDRKQIDDGRI